MKKGLRPNQDGRSLAPVRPALRPDEEGIKTFLTRCSSIITARPALRPDEEGIKTLVVSQLFGVWHVRP